MHKVKKDRSCFHVICAILHAFAVFASQFVAARALGVPLAAVVVVVVVGGGGGGGGAVDAFLNSDSAN